MTNIEAHWKRSLSDRKLPEKSHKKNFPKKQYVQSSKLSVETKPQTAEKLRGMKSPE